MINTCYPQIDSHMLHVLKDEYCSMLRIRPYSAVVKRYSDEFKSSFIYNANALEGSPLTHNDTDYIIKSNSFLENYTATQNMEVLGCSRAFDYILTLPEISPETMLRIHKHIIFFDDGNAGTYRKTPVHVGDKQMPDADVIHDGVRTLFAINKPDVFRQIALFHLQFENLHPFLDGNGRAGRMIINLQLMHAGFLPVNIKLNDAGRYCRCFRQFDIASEKGVQEMYNLLTKYEHEELTKIIELIRCNCP